MLDAVLKVFAGSVNQELVSALNRAGARGVGLSGIDACLVEAVQMDPALGAVGRVTRANPELLVPVRHHLEEWLPFPAPRVEVSALGEAAVIEGALAAGVDAALERVFARRVRA